MSVQHQQIRERYGNKASFIRKLKSTMLLHGITQSELAKASGYPASNISRWLSHGAEPTLDTVLVLDEAMESLLAR
jgi:transcriptional regulator with XRE-family HTH domain